MHLSLQIKRCQILPKMECTKRGVEPGSMYTSLRLTEDNARSLGLSIPSRRAVFAYRSNIAINKDPDQIAVFTCLDKNVVSIKQLKNDQSCCRYVSQTFISAIMDRTLPSVLAYTTAIKSVTFFCPETICSVAYPTYFFAVNYTSGSIFARQMS